MTNDKNLLADARQGNLPQMKKRMRNSIFKKAEDINQRDERFCSPLHYAAKNGNIPMIKFIVEKGGDLKATDKHGWSVLQYAIRYASLETVEVLLSLGCDLSHHEKKGWNCLHLAARNGQPEKARFLLEHGMNVNETQDQGWNALALAVRYGQPDTISTLLEYGIDINASNHGWTPLHLAALNGHTDIASILLNKGADTASVNDDGKSALDIAREEKHDRIVAIILEREFQTEQTLPSPPPTPPSAPPMELMSSAVYENGSAETFQEWRSRIRSELDRVDDPDSDEQEEGQANSGTMDVRITWKSFEEEAKELMNQLERLRRQEANKVKANVIRCKKEHKQKLLKLEKQRHILEAQIGSLETVVLRDLEQAFVQAESEQVGVLDEIDVLIENAAKEQELVEKLKDQQMENLYSDCASQEVKLLENLETTQRLEVQQLKHRRQEVVNCMDSLRQKKESDISVSKEKILILQENLSHLNASKSGAVKDHEVALQELSQQLERAERRSHLQANVNGGGPEQDEHWFGCPVCLVLLKPPMRIFQCPEGHILCEECKENPSMVHCPQCRCPLEGQCSRNRALEEVARSFYPMAPSETL